MIRTSVVISLRFNPGFLQTLIGYARLFKELGIQTEFMVSPLYTQFAELAAASPVISYNGGALSKGWDIAIFINPSVYNYRVGFQLKLYGSKVLYLYHEPWQMSPAYIWHEGLVNSMRAAAAHRATVSVLRLADRVLLPSKAALEIYRRADARYNSKALYFPLVFDDQTSKPLGDLIERKQYFSFIGNPCRSHGFANYIAVIRHAILSGDETHFLIASRFPIPKATLQDPVLQRHLHQIEIRCGKPLSEEEINECFAVSFCVWNLYRRSTQSGVLPKAFMFGAPVIASNTGSFPEFVRDGWNGRFADVRNLENVRAAMQEIRKHLPSFAFNCRSTFCDVFFYKSNIETFERMLEDL